MSAKSDISAAGSSFDFDVSAGQVNSGPIRYLLMRPDVLMGAINSLEKNIRDQVFEAFQQSAYENGMASFRTYQNKSFEDANAKVDFFCETAAQLGWGLFSYGENSTGEKLVTVRNSAYAAGYGDSDQPVCAPIAGIIRAMMEVFFEQHFDVAEVSCAAEGKDCCTFLLTSFS